MPVQDLYELNDLESSSILRVGQELTIAYSSAVAIATIEGFPDTHTRADGMIVYLVNEGDTLFGIAAGYGLELAELFKSNPSLNEESILRVGQEVIVGFRPTPAEVGGSTQLASPVPTAEEIQVQAIDTATPVPTMPLPSPTSAVTPETDAADVIETTASGDNSIFSNQTLIMILGVTILLAGTGGVLVYLSRRI